MELSLGAGIQKKTICQQQTLWLKFQKPAFYRYDVVIPS